MAQTGLAFGFPDPRSDHSSHRDLFYPQKSFLIFVIEVANEH
jgi:hypothetical protein